MEVATQLSTTGVLISLVAAVLLAIVGLRAARSGWWSKVLSGGQRRFEMRQR
jgi:hypothetical protein